MVPNEVPLPCIRIGGWKKAVQKYHISTIYAYKKTTKKRNRKVPVPLENAV